MGKEQNFANFDREYGRNRKTPWFALLVGAQIAVMLVIFLLGGQLPF